MIPETYCYFSQTYGCRYGESITLKAHLAPRKTASFQGSHAHVHAPSRASRRALQLVTQWSSDLRPKKSRAVLKEILPALGETMVPSCKDDADGAAGAALIGLRWRLHDKVHLDEPTARIHTAPSHSIYFWSTGSRFRRPAGPNDDLNHQLHRVPHRGLSVEPDRHCSPTSKSDPIISLLGWPVLTAERPLRGGAALRRHSGHGGGQQRAAMEEKISLGPVTEVRTGAPGAPLRNPRVSKTAVSKTRAVSTTRK